MSEIVVIPNFDRKTARFKGTVAAGEHVFVKIVGGSSLDVSSLRLRVVLYKTTLAVFPLAADTDSWMVDGEDVTCTLNLNTTQAVNKLRGVFETEVLFVLDDPVAKKLHFSDYCVIRVWPKEMGSDAPVDLDGYEDFVAQMKSRMSAVESAVETNASALAAESAARMAADSAHVGQISDMANAVSEKADASMLENFATKESVEAGKSELRKEIAAKQDAGDYITEHQSLEGLATVKQMNEALSDKADNAAIADLATKKELDEEKAARENADAVHDRHDEMQEQELAAVKESVEHAETHITNHALDESRHPVEKDIRAVISKTLAEKNYNFASMDGFIDAVIDIVQILGGAARE